MIGQEFTSECTPVGVSKHILSLSSHLLLPMPDSTPHMDRHNHYDSFANTKRAHDVFSHPYTLRCTLLSQYRNRSILRWQRAHHYTEKGMHVFIAYLVLALCLWPLFPYIPLPPLTFEGNAFPCFVGASVTPWLPRPVTTIGCRNAATANESLGSCLLYFFKPLMDDSICWFVWKFLGVVLMVDGCLNVPFYVCFSWYRRWHALLEHIRCALK